jgi:Rieske Fe-S protein
MPDMTPTTRITRRAAIATAGAGATALGLAACSPGGGAEPDQKELKATKDASGAQAVDASDVPVGGSVIVRTGSQSTPAVAVAQPKSGEFVAHTAVCTHQGCIVGAAGKELHCPCHGSQYDAFTGKVLHGPAQQPLAEVQVNVSGDSVEFSL